MCCWYSIARAIQFSTLGVGTIVTTIVVSDPDGEGVNFNPIDLSMGEYFTLVPTSSTVAELRVKTEPDREVSSLSLSLCMRVCVHSELTCISSFQCCLTHITGISAVPSQCHCVS